MAEEKSYEREMNAFDMMGNDAKKYLITNDEIDYSTSVVKHLKLEEFLLGDEL